MFDAYMLQTPLEDSKLDIAIFSLSLMGTNFLQFIREAHRTLRPGYILVGLGFCCIMYLCSSVCTSSCMTVASLYFHLTYSLHCVIKNVHFYKMVVVCKMLCNMKEYIYMFMFAL